MFRFSALLLAGFAVAMIAADAPKEIQGTWTVTKMEVGGKADDKPVGSTFTVTGDKFVIKHKDGKEEMSGTIKVDTSKKPGMIDMTIKGPDGKEISWQGLCEIDGDNLKCCMAAMPGGDRPKEVSAKETTMLVTLKREKK